MTTKASKLIFTLLLQLSFIGLVQAGKGIVHTGTIYNMQGPNASAWSFIGNAARTLEQENLDKDLVNTTHINDPMPFFRKELKATNGTSFVKAYNLSLEKSDYQTVRNYYRKHKATKVMQHLTKGDLYIVKLRKTQDYILMRVKEVKDDGTSLLYKKGDNLDYITFEYVMFEQETPAAVRFMERKEGSFAKEEGMEVVIFPDPLVHELSVRFENVKAEDSFTWYLKIENLNGKEVYRSPELSQTSWTGEVEHLNKGHYVLSLFKDQNLLLQKIIRKSVDDESDSRSTSQIIRKEE